MRQYIRSRRPVLATALTSAALMALAACGDTGADNGALASDSALGRDLALAQQDSAPSPQLQDIPAAPEPAPVSAPRARPGPQW